ncbi:MAG: response regulator transcription factor [Usitatibacter sp.]
MSVRAPAVCVVDDDPSVRRAMERLLRAAGFEVRTYAGAEEYLDAHDPAVPGCLVLDLTMPGVSGLQLQQALLARGEVPAIVFVSGHADAGASAEALRAGAVDFLTKPVDAAHLLAAVREAIDRDRAWRDLAGKPL